MSASPSAERPGGQLLRNLLACILFVAATYGIVAFHACVLKSSSIEAGLNVLTRFILPLSLFSAKSIGGIMGRAFLCGLMAVALNIAYIAWLHSNSFPREWLDASAKERPRQTRSANVEADNGAGLKPPLAEQAEQRNQPIRPGPGPDQS